MIEHIEKLPDTVIGLLAAGAVWFSFNYVVLGERALERYGNQQVMPACMAALDARQQRSTSPALGLGKLLGVPELDAMENALVERYAPPILSVAEKIARCECAVATSASGSRLDYAINTASFRLITSEAIGSLRSKAVRVLTSGGCGQLPEQEE
jgi:hypothetical protein